MKKILITIFFLNILILDSYSAESKDCSIYKKFNPKYYACKTANAIKSTADYQKKEWSKEKDKLIKKD